MREYKSSDAFFFAVVLVIMLFTSPGGGLLLVIGWLIYEGFRLRKIEIFEAERIEQERKSAENLAAFKKSQNLD
ncbi:hypothetical protein SG34_007085 [Thalassomonas viridans]|uniref:Uncharacterized protein n=1 Tax=Thalassomonas viridans TaxID=137584 RepID=A0AAE9Z5X6_9GAMM|nr:hypothetical protein [Thalassomonas viridans]WDE06664.1 hypothetical protein SG34_007085 [Thalassomonas viridans]